MLYVTLRFWKLLEFYLNMQTINEDSSVGVAVVVNKDNDDDVLPSQLQPNDEYRMEWTISCTGF